MVKKLFIALMVITAGISFSASACDVPRKERALLAKHKGQPLQEVVEVTPELMEIIAIAQRFLMDPKFERDFKCVPIAVLQEDQQHIARHNDLWLENWNPTQGAVSSRSCSRNN